MRPLNTTRAANKARIMMKGQHQAVHLENQLPGIGVRVQMFLVDRLLRCTLQR